MIATLQNQINELRGAEKKHFIVIGDSFSYGTIDSYTMGDGWINQLLDLYPEADITYLTAAQAALTPGVSGFASSKTFLSMLQQIEYFNPDLLKAEISDIVVIGGTNDIPYTATVIKSAINTFCAYCKTEYPHATVRIGVFGVNVENSTDVITAYSSCSEYGASFMYDLWGLVNTRAYLSDGTHMTQAGYDLYCPYVAESIIFGKTSYTSKGSGTFAGFATGDSTNYSFDVFNTSDGLSIQIGSATRIVPADSIDSAITTTVSGNAIITDLVNQQIPFDVYGYSNSEWTFAGNGTAYFPDATHLTFTFKKMAPVPTFSSYRIIMNNHSIQKRVPTVLS